MSAHMRTHHTSSYDNQFASILYVSFNDETYAIPKKIAEKYIVNDETIPSSVVFAKLEKQLTKAGALLKGLRTREGLSQEAFSKKINVTQSNLSNMENGHRPIGKIVAKRIEKVFGLDYRYFLE